MGHRSATGALSAVEQAGEEVAVERRAWPWARHRRHRRAIAISALMAEQVPLEPGLVPVPQAKYPGYRSSRCRSWALTIS